MLASMNGHFEVVKQLHEFGAQIDLQDVDGLSALMLAARMVTLKWSNFFMDLVLK